MDCPFTRIRKEGCESCRYRFHWGESAGLIHGSASTGGCVAHLTGTKNSAKNPAPDASLFGRERIKQENWRKVGGKQTSAGVNLGQRHKPLPKGRLAAKAGIKCRSKLPRQEGDSASRSLRPTRKAGSRDYGISPKKNEWPLANASKPTGEQEKSGGDGKFLLSTHREIMRV